MPDPIVLMLPPDGVRFLGTFDVENFKEWWYSYPMPGDIEKVLSSMWTYGYIHLALCLMKDGTYSIYQSINQGKSWAEVYNTPLKIYDLLWVDFGWVLVSTEDGWLESNDSGTTYHVLSTDAPGCRQIIRLGESSLMAHDGTRIWLSTIMGVSWTIVLTLTGEHPAALAGNYLRAVVGAGDTLYKTDNQGTSFEVLMRWPGCTILDILHTDDGEWTPEVNSYLVRVLMPAEGIVRHYFTPDGGQTWNPRYDQFYAPADRSVSYAAVLNPGSDQWSSLVFSAQTRINTAENRQEISLKYSRNDGKDWIDIDASQIALVPPRGD
jgi:hypothetical protein